MVRKFIELDKLNFFDWMHQSNGQGGFVVDEKADGKTTEEHRAGIDYIKQVLNNGQKILPILVRDNEDGTYQQLDGFKRAWAVHELGWPVIEAFVCSQWEFDKAVEFPWGKYKMRAFHGGQDGEMGKFPLFEGAEAVEFDYDKTKFLYKSPNGDGLRIELCEAIHVHFGPVGRYRFLLGKEDFVTLAEAVSKI